MSTLPILSQAQEQQGGQGPDLFTIILLVGAGLLLFMMFRKSRKAQQEQVKMRTSLAPGTRIMTQFGLFGEVVSIDGDNSEVILELSPGNFATVHLQTVTRILDETPAEETAETAVTENEPTFEDPQADRDTSPENPENPDERR